MTRDEIIKMARETGVEAYAPTCMAAESYSEFLSRLERFAAHVVSRHVKEARPKPDGFEREWLQQIAYQHGGIGDLCGTEFEFGAMVAAAEREACAKVAESGNFLHDDSPAARFGKECAAAIRRRREK